MSVVVVGRNSFLAQAVRHSGGAEDWIFLSHDEALFDRAWVDQAHCIVNFAFWPGFKGAAYDAERDIDTKLARLIAGRGVHYIMVSSRKVYGILPRAGALREDKVPAPADFYGRAKYAVERSLGEVLGAERLTILRAANVFGYEPGRKTFVGQAMTSLRRDGKIVFDMAPETVRDFIPAAYFADSLRAVTAKRAAGIYNLGAGFGMACGRVAACLIEGYGTGDVVVTDPAPRDAFWLDMDKTRACFQLPAVRQEDIESGLTAYGRQLRQQI
jgi:dTDP-4-dehydrorhamnose reductase/UDP-glucose 4-epimerase